jgi:C4-type Zn-finger protein
MKTLIPLAEYNATATAQWRNRDTRRGNGIECPKCKAELRDVGDTLSTVPPKRTVYCDQCRYRGLRVDVGIGGSQ